MPPLRPKRIGLLGGSFNPAHEGHLHISRLALERLDLDQIWWLVSPQNPLKPPAGMATFPSRIEQAEHVASADPRIMVSDFEQTLTSHYSVETIAALKQQFPDVAFVWVMGADLLVQMPRWRKWRGLFRTVPIAVFARPAYVTRALAGKAARRFMGSRISRFRARSLVDMKPPAWAFLRTRLNTQSATALRAQARHEGNE